MRLITKDTDYAMRALVYICSKKDKLYRVKEISEHLKISHSFLRKLLQILNKNKILTSVRGKDGGFRLNKDPEDIYLTDLIKIFQGDFEVKHCVIKTNICPNVKTCLLNKKLDTIERFIIAEIESININSLIKDERFVRRKHANE